MTETGQRIMRLPLPVTLIREMDAVILKGLGGYTTRAEFIIDAIQERVLELSIGVVEDAGPPPGQGGAPVHAALVARATDTAEAVEQRPMASLPMTALTPPSTGALIAHAEDLNRPEGRPLFGLHNRDYPSLWALSKLAKLTTTGPVPVEQFYVKVLREAWRFGELLLATEKHLGVKCTALFPTNPKKRKPAETGFRSFAIGDYRGGSGTYTTSGPLFEWRLAGLVQDDKNGLLIGITSDGWTILKAVAGISVEEPHPPAAAATFLAHLAEHAPADLRGFTEIVRAIGPEGATRQNVLEHVAKAWTDWTDNEISTNSAGYIARAREWGLVEPKQTNAQYHLTPLGYEHVTGEER